MGHIILAVDDSQTMRDMLRITLEADGHKVCVAQDGAEALEVIGDRIEKNDLPDAVITDINMPRMNGIEFIQGLRALDETRLTPVLVLSTESADNLKQRAKEAGATGWIVKPFEPEKLLRAIKLVAG